MSITFSSRTANLLVTLDYICNYIPVISTATNLGIIFQKYVLIPKIKNLPISETPYIRYVENKSLKRSITLLVPVIGNSWITIELILHLAEKPLIIMGIKSLKNASENLKNDPKLVLSRVRKKGLDLKYASEDLRNNYQIVLEAVHQNGLALQFASEELLNNFEIVSAAVNQSGLSLRFASKELKNNSAILASAKLQFLHKFGRKKIFKNKQRLTVVRNYSRVLREENKTANSNMRFNQVIKCLFNFYLVL